MSERECPLCKTRCEYGRNESDNSEYDGISRWYICPDCGKLKVTEGAELNLEGSPKHICLEHATFAKEYHAANPESLIYFYRKRQLDHEGKESYSLSRDAIPVPPY